MTGRSVPEWVGKTPDTKVPPRVRHRVLLAYGRRCYLSDIPIVDGMAWELEHKIALHKGGENRESNLAPALAKPHKVKTALERAEKKKTDAVAKKASGSVAAPARPIKSAPFPYRSTKRDKNPMSIDHLPRRSMFADGAT